MKYLLSVNAVKIVAVSIKGKEIWITPDEGIPFKIQLQYFDPLPNKGDYWVTYESHSEAIPAEEFIKMANLDIKVNILNAINKWDLRSDIVSEIMGIITR